MTLAERTAVLCRLEDCYNGVAPFMLEDGFAVKVFSGMPVNAGWLLEVRRVLATARAISKTLDDSFHVGCAPVTGEIIFYQGDLIGGAGIQIHVIWHRRGRVDAAGESLGAETGKENA